MQTKTLIQSSANILKITELAIGNTIKVVDKDYNGSELQYGVVTDLLNSGAETFIELLLFKKSYSEITAKIKLFNGKDEVSLFPATPEDIRESLGDALKGLDDKIKTAKKDLQKAIDTYDKTKSFIDGEMAKKLVAASFTSVTTEEYLAVEAAKQKQIEAINEQS